MEILELDIDNPLLLISSIPTENRPVLPGVQASWTQRQGHVHPHFCENSMWRMLWYHLHAPLHTQVYTSASFVDIHGPRFGSKNVTYLWK